MNQPLEIGALEQLATEFRRAAADERRTAGRPKVRAGVRPVLVGVAAAAAIPCTASAATLLLREGEPLPEAPAGDFSADQRPLPESAHLAGVQTADPGGGPPWGVRIFTNKAGAHCFTPGRIVNGKLGTVVGGVFRELPLRGPGSCVQFHGRQRPLGMSGHYYPSDNRSVIYGVAGPLVRTIAFDTGLQSKTIIPDADGAYIAVFEGDPHVRRIITFTDGTQDVLDPPRDP